jgi:RNA polymerase sigma-70 factor (ECF subfamily)
MNRQVDMLFAQHRECLFRYALKLTWNVDDAQDLVQDTMVRAYQSFGRFRANSAFQSWAWKIMKNAHYDQYRRSRRSVDALPIEDELLEHYVVGPSGNPHAVFIAIEESEQLSHMLATVPKRDAQFVVLHYVYGFSYGELAKQYRLKEEYIKGRVFKTCRKLQQSFCHPGAE